MGEQIFLVQAFREGEAIGNFCDEEAQAVREYHQDTHALLWSNFGLGYQRHLVH